MTTIGSDELRARVAWALLREPGEQLAGSLVQRLGHVDALTALSEGTPSELDDVVPGISPHLARWRPRLSSHRVEEALEEADRHGLHLVAPPTVPGLGDLGSRIPHLLWVQGDPSALLARRRLTVTGPGAISPSDAALTTSITRAASQDGVSIHAGGTGDVHRTAHRAALASSSAGTIAWMPGGLLHEGPGSRAPELARIATNPRSALVSELPPRTSPTLSRTLAQARLLAAAGQSTVVVGSAATLPPVVAWARALNRPVEVERLAQRISSGE